MKKTLIIIGVVLLVALLGFHAVWGCYYFRCKKMNEELNEVIGGSGVEVDGWLYSFNMPTYPRFNASASVADGFTTHVFDEKEELLMTVMFLPRVVGTPHICFYIWDYHTDSLGEGEIHYEFEHLYYEVDTEMNMVVGRNKEFFDAHREELQVAYDRAAAVWSVLR